MALGNAKMTSPFYSVVELTLHLSILDNQYPPFSCPFYYLLVAEGKYQLISDGLYEFPWFSRRSLPHAHDGLDQLGIPNFNSQGVFSMLG